MNYFYNTVKKTIENFNEIHKANCKLLEITGDEIKVLFEGHICFTCGAYDYFEDLAILLSKILGREYGVEKYEQQEDGTYIVYFKPKEFIKEIKKDIYVIFLE